MVFTGKVAGGVWDLATPGSIPLLSVAVGSTQDTVATVDPASGPTTWLAGQLEMTGSVVSGMEGLLTMTTNEHTAAFPEGSVKV